MPKKKQRKPKSKTNWDELIRKQESIGSIPRKGSSIEVRKLYLSDGRTVIDVRKFVDQPSYNGPTKEGWWLDPQEAEILEKLLAEARDPGPLEY